MKTQQHFPGQDWSHSRPEDHGIDPDKLQEAVAHISAVSGPQGNEEVLIVKDGAVIHAGPEVERSHIVWSCTKSFCSTCFGLLWDDDKVEPDMLASDLYPELQEHYPTITLRHFLTFTSGYQSADGSALNIDVPRHAPGAAFHYSNQSDMLAAILTRVAERPLSELFKERIGDPIGIDYDNMHWGSAGTVDGITVNGGSGMPGTAVEINALNMARFGWLYANNGSWNGKQLISRRYISEACVPQTSPDTPPFDPRGWYTSLPGNYGLHWWCNGPLPDSGKARWPNAPANTFAAQGNNNNVCFIVRDWNMLIIRLGTDAIIGMQHYDKVFELLNPDQA